jgi:hypothetical protein
MKAKRPRIRGARTLPHCLAAAIPALVSEGGVKGL